MNYMYNFGINIHNGSIIALLAMIFINGVLLLKAHDLFAFRKQMAYTTPISAVFLAFILFTGIVMMLTKHLHFSIANGVMIVVGVIFIMLEVKRVKPLKYLKNLPHAIPLYRSFALKILVIEFVIILALSLWMWK
jgi:hypothetical protein